MTNKPRCLELPNDWELIGFFEAEPELADEQVPWAYNELKFLTKRDADLIICTIAPSYCRINLHWSRSGASLVDLELGCARNLKVCFENGREWLEVEFDPNSVLLPFTLQLKPTVSIQWGISEW